jgi:hypothetical protein
MTTTTNNNNNNNNNNKTPITDLIVLLNEYNDSHISASSSFKSAIWDLNKARRQRGRNMMSMALAFSALDVREELRAQSVLDVDVDADVDVSTGNDVDVDVDVEPSLEDEDGDTFTLRYNVNGGEEKTTTITNTSTSATTTTSIGIVGDDGIRQRKKGSLATNNKEGNNNNNNSNKNNKWTEESVSYIDKEEEKLINTDPLDLFGGGLTPIDLKRASKHAKESLASYIEAANQVSKIMKLVNSIEDASSGDGK